MENDLVGNNMHMLVGSTLTREELAAHFRSEGWKVHLLDDSPNEARFENGYADLEYTRLNSREFLLNGTVRVLTLNYKHIILLLKKAGIDPSKIVCDEVDEI